MKEIYDYKKAKFEYREFCRLEPSINVFMRDWYLDAVSESTEDWQVILYKEKEEIAAAFPFAYKKIKGNWKIYNPWQAARLGIWIREEANESEYKYIARVESIVDYILNYLPYYDNFAISFSSDFHNWQSFFNRGFTQSTYYSQILQPKPEETLLKEMQKYRRKEIRKAFNLYTVKILQDENIFYEFMKNYYLRKGQQISFTKQNFVKLYRGLQAHGNVMMTAAYNNENSIAAELFTVFDNKRSYTLFVAFNNEEPGARALLDWYGICYFTQKGLTYDFEGSMIQGVSEYNRRYNAYSEPYYVITHSSRKYNILRSLKTILTNIKI